jgi:type I restriction enzyme R subunit
VHLGEDPVFYQSLKERLEKIIEERKQERINAAEELKILNSLVEEIRDIGKIASEMGFSEEEYALYKILASDAVDENKDDKLKGFEGRETSPGYVLKKDANKELTHSIMESIGKFTVIDWIHKDDVQREMRRQIKNILRTKKYAFEEIESLTRKIMDLAKVRLTK